MNAGTQLADELRRIPKFAVALAVLVFCGGLLAFSMLFGRNPDTGGWPVVFQTSLAALIAGVLTVYILMVGYVFADAGRRQMSRLLWTLLVIFVPNALGFVLYFLLRRPVPARCPGCSAAIEEGVHYCPRCGAQLANACPGCHRAVRLGDAFCSNCGHRLEEGPETA